MNEMTPDGTDLVKKKAAIVVYAVAVIVKIPYIVRDDYEEALLMTQLAESGYRVISMNIEVPINFRGWHFPKPLKPSEPSLN